MKYFINASAAIKYCMLAISSGEREVGGFAKFEFDAKNDLIITDIFPLRQRSSCVYFEISAEANAEFLENVVESGGSPSEYLMFHTHPSGMSANMSSVDIDHLEELARDAPGRIVRSMILPQGGLMPTMHTAVCIDGVIFVSDNIAMKLLDDTGAKESLDAIGWFDAPPKVQERIGWLQPVEAPSIDDCSDFLQDDWQDYDDSIVDSYIGKIVSYAGRTRYIVDAYSIEGSIAFVLDGNQEIWMEECTIIEQVS